MTNGFAKLPLAVSLVYCLLLVGCFAVPDEEAESAGDANGGEDVEVLLKPFEAPPLEQLDSRIEWEERPVLDPLVLLRERQSTEEVLATVEEALSLRNTSADANAKILSALGRLPATDADVDWDATMIRHTRADVKSTNPIMISSTAEFEVTGLTGFGLFSFDWDFNPLADARVAQSWHSSTDRKYDKVVMRDDLTWSDGEPITAHDIVFSFKTIMNPRVPVPAVRSGTDQIRWIEAYDDHTLVFFHKEALATNIWNVNFPVLPKHIYEESIHDDYTLQNSDYHVKYENDPICGGPYEIVDRSRNQEIVLRRRESWYLHDGTQVRPKPYFAEIRFRVIKDDNTALLALKSGDIEDKLLTAQEWQTETEDSEFYRNNTKATAEEWTTFSFIWNCETPYFSDKRVRQAMSHAFDHDEMLNELLYGLHRPSLGPFNPSSWWGPTDPPQPYKQNLERAEQLLDEAGWSDHDGDGIRDKQIGGRSVPFEFSIATMNVDDRIAICTLLQENLDRIGIICHVRPMEFTTLQEKQRKHEFHAVFGGWGTGVDPDTSENIFATDQGRNYGQYSNPEVDRLFAEGKKEFDREKRAEVYRKIHELMWDDQPYTWLYYRNAFYGFNKSLRGYVFSPRGPYNYGPGFDAIWKPVN